MLCSCHFGLDGMRLWTDRQESKQRPLWALSIVHPEGDEEVLIHNLGVGEFSGEVNMLSARPSLVRARMTAAGELLVIDSEDLRRVVQSDAELSELLMRAFILRRVALIGS